MWQKGFKHTPLLGGRPMLGFVATTIELMMERHVHVSLVR
eukprot:COSAG01_NODE_168_length_23206_cov_14.301467_7_plen_40_part_00